MVDNAALIPFKEYILQASAIVVYPILVHANSPEKKI